MVRAGSMGAMGESQGAERGPVTPDGSAAPVKGAKRIASIDVLRGVALLGILVMNIPIFALTSAAFFYPPAAGGFEGVDYGVWLGSRLLFEQKMMTIFSMLFGAGIVLFAEKAIAKRGRAAGLHYRRMGWLLLIGLAHAYLVWEGDILTTYALCGMMVYGLRFLRARWLVPIAIVLMAVAPLLGTAQGLFFGFVRAQSQEAAVLREAGEEVPSGMATWAEVWDGTYDEETGELVKEGLGTGFVPGPERMEEEREAVLGSWWDRVSFRAKDTIFFHTYVNLTWGFWRVCGVMALGMALFKLGVFSASRSVGFYGVMASVGFAIGVSLDAVGSWAMAREGYDFVAMFTYTWHFNAVGSVFSALGWTGLVMLVCRVGALGLVRSGLAAVGRMAFTNYLLQSLICATIFFGHGGLGIGYFGSFSRSELVPFVLGVWAFEIALSVVWLRAFRFGPMEWVWRSLTYWRLQPLRRGGADG